MISGNGGGAVRVVVAAASAVRRGGLEAIVRGNSSLRLVGSSPTLVGLASRIQEMQAAVVLADLPEPDSQFIATAAMLEQAGTGVVALIDSPDAKWTARALRSGVRAILPRDSAESEIQAAVSAVESGLVLLDPAVTRDLASQARVTNPEMAPEILEELTSREVEVLKLMAEGFGNKEIGSRLGITDHTVKFHISSILAKLGASSRTEAVTQGIRMGLIVI
jgi:two-component system, NarL family, response regulator YdfI